MSIILVVLIISFLVIIHELGHFFLAKKHKIKVEEFGLGYPPKLFKLFRWLDTDFTVNAIPFGGFVRLEGENGPEEKTADQAEKKSQPKEQAFYQKSASAKIQVLLAGVVINFIFGCLAFCLIFSFMGIPTSLNNQPIIGQLSTNSPAAVAQLPLNSSIEALQLEGEALVKVNHINQVQDFVKIHQGQTIKIYLSQECQMDLCQSAMTEYQIYLRKDDEIPANEGSMGIMFADYYLKFYPWYEMPFRAMFYGVKQAVSLGLLILVTLLSVFKDLLTHGSLPQDVAGPVGIAHQANEFNLAGQDWATLLNFAGMLSINLAIMNLLPLPALDGGRALFVLLGKFIGKNKLEKLESYLNYAGFSLLILLMILVTIRDVSRWIGI